jgi:hypothetical protein
MYSAKQRAVAPSQTDCRRQSTSAARHRADRLLRPRGDRRWRHVWRAGDDFLLQGAVNRRAPADAPERSPRRRRSQGLLRQAIAPSRRAQLGCAVCWMDLPPGMRSPAANRVRMALDGSRFGHDPGGDVPQHALGVPEEDAPCEPAHVWGAGGLAEQKRARGVVAQPSGLTLLSRVAFWSRKAVSFSLRTTSSTGVTFFFSHSRSLLARSTSRCCKAARAALS